MKNLTVYKVTKGDFNFDFTDIDLMVATDLTDLQREKLGFLDLGEGSLYTNQIQGYTVFKVRHSKRKDIKPATLEREFSKRTKRLTDKEVDFDMEQVLREVEEDLTRMSDISHDDCVVAYDHANHQFLFGCTPSKASEAYRLIRDVIEEVDAETEEEEFQILPFEANHYFFQQVLTSFIENPKLVPEPFEFGSKINLGKKSVAGAKAPSSNVKITKEYPVISEVLNHLEQGKMVHALELDYDGVIFFTLSQKFDITGISFEEKLKYEENEEMGEEENFIAEYTLKLTDISNMLNILFPLTVNNEEGEE